MYSEILNAKRYQKDAEKQAANERLASQLRREQGNKVVAKLGQVLVAVGQRLEAHADTDKLEHVYR